MAASRCVFSRFLSRHGVAQPFLIVISSASIDFPRSLSTKLYANRINSSSSGPNKGSAPRPNFNRGLAGVAISPIPDTTTSTYSGNTISLPVARRNLQNTQIVDAPLSQKSGWVSVREGRTFFQSWKQKYLVLRKDWLDFCKSEGGKVSYTLFLSDVVGIGRVETSTPTFEIKRKRSGSSTSPGDDDGETQTLQVKVKTEDDLYTWIDFIYNASSEIGGIGIGLPTNFSHAVHVGFDFQNSQFTGLPTEWLKLLNTSTITKADYERNPQAVVEAVDFYTDLRRTEDELDSPPDLLLAETTLAEKSPTDLGSSQNLPGKTQITVRLHERSVTGGNSSQYPKSATGQTQMTPSPPSANSFATRMQNTTAMDKNTLQPGKNIDRHIAPDAGMHETTKAVEETEIGETENPVATTLKQTGHPRTTVAIVAMDKLRAIVSLEDPNQSYAKQRKIGQGASGSVYVAKIKDTATGVAQNIRLEQGSRTLVAIKQMNLSRQPRKELLIDEIVVMKENRHRNIINFLDSFLLNEERDLWLIMDYMDGGALIDIIDNNPRLSERHMAAICREVCSLGQVSTDNFQSQI